MPPPRISADERRTRLAERLQTIRLRVMIGRALEDRGPATPTAIGQALGLAPAAAQALLSRKQRPDGDVAALQAAARRLGIGDC